MRYDPAEFVVPPSLGKDGKSERIQCYVQAGHVRALNIIGRSGVFPFDEKNDVVRWSIKLGLEKLNLMEPTLINSVMRRTNIMIAGARDSIERAKFTESFNLLRERINSVRSENDKADAVYLYRLYKDQIMKMPDEPDREFRWKMKYLDELEHFKHVDPDEESSN